MAILELDSLTETDVQKRFCLQRRIAVSERLGQVSKMLCEGQAEAGAEYCQLIGNLIEVNGDLGLLGLTYQGLSRSVLEHDSRDPNCTTPPDPNIDLIRALLNQRTEDGPL